MSRRRTAAGGKLKKRSRIAHQPRLEPLESRRLLAGLEVSVFVDEDASRDFSNHSDAPAQGRLVFVDLDRSGQYDVGEPLQVTGAEGVAFFSDIEAGDYSIGILTNPNQRQTTSTRVAASAVRESTYESGTLVSSGQIEQTWIIDETGFASRVIDPLQTVDFGGAIVDYAVDKQKLFAVVDSPDATRLVTMDLETASISSIVISGLHDNDVVTGLAGGNGEITLFLSTESGSAFATLETSPGLANVVDRFSVPAATFAASASTPLIAYAETLENNSSVIRTHNPTGSAQDASSITLTGIAEQIAFSTDGSLIYVAMTGGGVSAIRISPTGALSLASILADARAPITANSVDGRLITGNSLNPSSITVWDTKTWSPIGTSVLPSSEAVATLATDHFGDAAVIGTATGIYTVDLATPERKQVTVGSTQAPVRIGLRVAAENSAPSADNFSPRTIAEDNRDQIAFNADSGVSDRDGDQLWYVIATPPRHGELYVTGDGIWNYQPRQDFHGADTAVLRVFDGLASTELTLRWAVSPVNDPPQAVFVNLPPLMENAEPGTPIGFVSVVDPDSDARYLITTSDPRFVVSNGEIFFADGELDYDSGAEINFDVYATDAENPDYSIVQTARVQLENVNEPPVSIEVQSQTIAENTPGASLGTVSVEDPDADSEYHYQVSDPRFEVVDGILRLREGVSVDYEAEGTIEVEISAAEIGETGFGLTRTVTIAVTNNNDQPTGIQLSGASVPRQTSGAVVGEIAVLDPDNDSYSFQVSDDRFEVVDGILRLREDIQIEEATDSSIHVSVLATTASGDSTTAEFSLGVVRPPSPHRNPNLPADVNGDGVVTPIDVLMLINELNRRGAGPLPTGTGGEGLPFMPDVNGDGILSPLDILIIINDLNRDLPPEAEGEGGVGLASTEGATFVDDIERRRRENSVIDAELESLIEELSRKRFS